MAKTEYSANIEQIAKEMAQYEKTFANSQFTKRQAFMEKYAGWDGLKLWKQEVADSYHPGAAYSAYQSNVAPLDFEKAKPFIRAVIERMLDLLDSEERWTKHAVAHDAQGNTVSADDPRAEKWCLIGAQAKALSDLQLSQLQTDKEVERQRHRVLKAVEDFLKQRMSHENGISALPSWNDAAGTSFEDVRLWLKGCLTHLED